MFLNPYQCIHYWFVKSVGDIVGGDGVAFVLFGREFFIEYDVLVEVHLNLS